jgi:kynurenine formamidase
MALVQETIHERRFSRRHALGLAAGSAGAIALGHRDPRATAAATTQSLRFSEIVDLTHTLNPEFPVFPGYPAFNSYAASTIADTGSLAYVLNVVEHNGTHVDAPAHFAVDGETVEAIPIERLVAPLAVIDIAARAEDDPDAMLTVDDILAWEDEHGELPSGVFVALHSGWQTRADDAASFLNPDASGTLHFPGWSPEAAAFLIEERDITGVGTDTISLDIGATSDWGAHLTFLPAGKFGVECLANLDQIPSSGATIIVGAPMHRGGSGGQARVLALA